MMLEQRDKTARATQSEGVSLDRYATVLAMRNEGLPLDEALLRAGVDAHLWAAEESAWEARIARADEARIAEFDEALAAAQDRLARPIPPIDRDLTAWLDFLRHWSKSSSPMELLASLALRVEDVFRLQRAWGRRLKEDASLRQSAGRIMAQPPGPMPAIRPEPLVLEPLPAPESQPSAPARDAAAVLPPLFVSLPESGNIDEPLPPEPAKSLTSRPKPPPEPAKPLNPPTPLAAPPILEAPRPAARASAAAKTPEPSFVPEGMRHFKSLGGTHAAPTTAPKGPVLPFQKGAAEDEGALKRAMTHADAVQGPRRPAPVAPAGGATEDISAVVRAVIQATPFEGTASTPPAAAVAAPSIVPEGMQHFKSLGGTHAEPTTAPKAPALPFQKEATTEKGPALERASTHADTIQGSRRALPVGGATEDISAAVRAALPVTPFEAKATPAPSAPVPMSLEQYASLCVEAALHPEKLSETLERYHLTAEQRAALDAHWQGKMASSPEIRAAWERACATYRQWLLAQRG